MYIYIYIYIHIYIIYIYKGFTERERERERDAREGPNPVAPCPCRGHNSQQDLGGVGVNVRKLPVRSCGDPFSSDAWSAHLDLDGHVLEDDELILTPLRRSPFVGQRHSGRHSS